MSGPEQPRWEAPPPDGRSRRTGTDWTGIAEMAKARPGEWLAVPGVWARGANIRRHRAFQGHRWEITTRATDGRARVRVWLRYLGPETEQ